MGKQKVSDFNQAVCRGSHPDVSEPCPHLAEMDEDTGNETVDRLARVESKILGALNRQTDYKCGLCGCPLRNLGATNYAPDDCPRLEVHDR